ncbi:MAG: pyrroloquinoline quinone biosynthesis protein PqqE [Alphaproteobacteria bacterium]|nr:pyrroloquinoline quinone biosynthesis protein PqqE [Alphaproteobacteria bacterium]
MTATLEPPLAMLAEVTHRCPLQCPYCSNPLELDRKAAELSTEEWRRVLDEAAALGVLQVHFSGGEPTARADIVELIAHAAEAGLYTNLITSGVLMNEGALDALLDAGLDHVQLSFQDAEAANADRIGGYRGGHEKKLALARQVRARKVPLTVNAVVHRQNLEHLPEIIQMAVDLDAARLEVAHVQYYGWALKNRAALIPSREQVDAAGALVQQAIEDLKGRMVIDFVIPDYYARFPKACMGGWARKSLNVTPSGKVLPCHAAETIPGLIFDTVRDKPLAEIWAGSQAFETYRGTDWMEEPCRSCERKELDWGGCRCQALALAGRAEATDPACSLSPLHADIVRLAERESAEPPPAFAYRRISGAAATGEKASVA